jgi:alanyl-tRNA synthetase
MSLESPKELHKMQNLISTYIDNSDGSSLSVWKIYKLIRECIRPEPINYDILINSLKNLLERNRSMKVQDMIIISRCILSLQYNDSYGVGTSVTDELLDETRFTRDFKLYCRFCSKEIPLVYCSCEYYIREIDVLQGKSIGNKYGVEFRPILFSEVDGKLL